MYRLALVCFSVLSISYCSSSDLHLFPEGKQWTYAYHGKVNSGTVLPIDAASQWDIQAVLKVSSAKGTILAELSDLSTTLYNGPVNEVPGTITKSPVPEVALTALSIPFSINYNGTFIQSIKVSKDDPLWSVNMKRGIASVLQLDLKQLEHAASFSSEKNLYGDCSNIAYSVDNSTKGKIEITKILNPNKCTNYPAHIWSSSSNFKCRDDNENPIGSSTIRKYVLKASEGHFDIERIVSQRRVIVQPFHANGEIQVSLQSQEFVLKDVSSITEIPKISSDLSETTIAYVQNIRNLSSGRQKHNQGSNMESKHMLLNAVVADIDDNHLDVSVVDYHRELLFLYYEFFILNKESLDHLYSNFSAGTSYKQETKRNIFLELLPHVGSEVSVNFIKDLILKRDLKELLSIKILSMYPLYVKEYSEKLLDDMEVLLTLNNKYERSVRNAAILSFATLVHKTYMAGKCSLDKFETYALKYFNLFAESDSHEKKMLYLQGMDNLELGSIPKYLESTVQNTGNSRHIRLLAAWALIKNAKESSEKMYEIYWPIFTNKTEHLQLRTIAMSTLLVAEPTKAQVLALFWHLQEDKNPALYNFLHSTLTSLKNSKYPCFKHLKILARYIERYVKDPSKNSFIPGHYIVDYKDSDRAFGGILQLILLGNKNSNIPEVAYIEVNNYGAGKNLNQLAIYLKMEGMSPHLSKILKSASSIKPINDLLSVIDFNPTEETSDKEMHMELIIKVQGKSVFAAYIGNNNFDALKTGLGYAQLFTEYHLNYQSIIMPYIKEYMEPTDLGTLLIKATISNSIASVRSTSMKKSLDTGKQFNYYGELRYYTYTISFLELYNPISDTWHGMERNRKLQAKLNYNGSVIFDENNSLLEIHDNRDGHEILDVFLHSDSYTYLVSNGTSGLLQYFCPECENIHNITQGPVNKKINLWNTILPNVGGKARLTIFDCDSYKEIQNIIPNVKQSHRSNHEIMPAMESWLYAMHLMDYVSYIPGHGRCGASFIIKSIQKQPSQLIATFDILDDGNKSKKEAQFKHTNLYVRERILPNGEATSMWNATFDISLNKELTNFNMFVTLDSVHGAPHESVVCYNSNLQWSTTEKQAKSLNLYFLEGCKSSDASLCTENCTSFSTKMKSSLSNTLNSIESKLNHK